MHVRKGVIFAAGKGSRMGLLTKSIPKPMLPLGDKPIIQHIIDELFVSGIEEIAIVVHYQKHIIEDYVKDDKRIQVIEQLGLNGTAGALLSVKSFLNNEPFVLCLGDEVVVGEHPCIKELLDVFHQHSPAMVTGIEATTEEKIRHYNALVLTSLLPSLYHIHDMVEKPTKDIPSCYTSIGRYVLSPVVFDYLKQLTFSPQHETYLTQAFSKMAQHEQVLGKQISGFRYELGNPRDWLNANVIVTASDESLRN